MSKLTDCICSALLILATACPATSGDNRTERRQVQQARYRVGLMFAGGGCLPDGSGLTIHDVAIDGAAARAGLKAGDVITHINGKKTGSDSSEFASVFGASAAIEFRILRDGKSLSVTVVPKKPQMQAAPPAYRVKQVRRLGPSVTTGAPLLR